MSQIREISIEDLLGRDTIELDMERIHQYLSAKKVMVTGAAGSIGRELCRQILKIGPKQLILFERAENELFYVDLEFAKQSFNGLYTPVLGDILDVSRLERTMKEFQPDVVFTQQPTSMFPCRRRIPWKP